MPRGNDDYTAKLPAGAPLPAGYAAPVPLTAVPAGIADPVVAARAELKAALTALEVKGNIPKRVDQAARRRQRQFARFAQEKPVEFIAVAVGVAAAVGGVVYLIARGISR